MENPRIRRGPGLSSRRARNGRPDRPREHRGEHERGPLHGPRGGVRGLRLELARAPPERRRRHGRRRPDPDDEGFRHRARRHRPLRRRAATCSSTASRPRTSSTRAYAKAASDDYVDEEAGQRESFRSVLERIERYAEPRRDPRRRLLGGLPARRGARPRLARADRDRAEPLRLRLRARRSSGSTSAPTSSSPPTCPKAHFDAVVLGDVLEHLTSRRRGARPGRRAAAPRAACLRWSCPTPAAASPGSSARAGGR